METIINLRSIPKGWQPLKKGSFSNLISKARILEPSFLYCKKYILKVVYIILKTGLDISNVLI